MLEMGVGLGSQCDATQDFFLTMRGEVELSDTLSWFIHIYLSALSMSVYVCVCETLFTPGVKIHPDWSHHKWPVLTVLNTGVNVSETFCHHNILLVCRVDILNFTGIKQL